jgi:1,4-dihydroxy-2-naphthoate octaprenyltransferase
MSGLKPWAGVARAPFLLLPPMLIASGAGAAAWEGAFSWLRTAVALVGLVVLHMAVNILNEWSDMRTGIDLHTERTPFSGGSGTLPAGAMGLRTALVYGLVCSAVGLAIGLWFLREVGPVVLPLFVAGAIAVLAYTDLLARIGVGELAAGFGLGAGPVVGAAVVQNGTWVPASFWVAVPAFFMTFNLLFLNEFPDEPADRHGGRRNLVILLGRRAAAWVYAAAAVATPTVIIVGVVVGALPTPVLLGAVPSLLLTKPLAWVAAGPEQPVPVPALGANVIWNLATNALVAAGFAIAILMR